MLRVVSGRADFARLAANDPLGYMLVDANGRRNADLHPSSRQTVRRRGAEGTDRLSGRKSTGGRGDSGNRRRPKAAFRRLGPRQEGRCAGDLLLRRRTNAGLRASRLCEVRQDRFESAGAAHNPRFGRCAQEQRKGEKMSTFGEDLIQSLNEALAHAKGEGPAIVHAPVTPREVRKQAKLTQAQMAPLMGMSLSGYRKWEQGVRRVSGPAATLLRVIQKEPEAVRRALQSH